MRLNEMNKCQIPFGSQIIVHYYVYTSTSEVLAPEFNMCCIHPNNTLLNKASYLVSKQSDLELLWKQDEKQNEFTKMLTGRMKSMHQLQRRHPINSTCLDNMNSDEEIHRDR